MPVKNGLIVMWSGAIVDVPPGWHLCDGTYGTPDLRDKFLVGAGSSYDPRDEGGSDEHKHSYLSSGHTHDLTGGSTLELGTGYDHTLTPAQISGDTDNASTLPPYYALCFIMSI